MPVSHPRHDLYLIYFSLTTRGDTQTFSTVLFRKKIFQNPDPNLTSALARLGDVHLDGLAAVDGDAVELADGGLGGVLVDHGDEGVALSGVVDVGDLAAPAKLVLEDITGAVLVDPVDEKLRTLRHFAPASDSASFSPEKSRRFVFSLDSG